MKAQANHAALRLRQRGAALLIAMLTVALVATFAATALWQQWRSIEVESAERARVQSGWILTGALDWARLLLREDARSGGPDHLGEPWAVPLQEAKLSSFLAAEHNVSTDSDADVLEAFLSGQIIDEQSMLNVTNLVDAGRVSDGDLRSFQRLFELLGLPPAQLDAMVENLRFALDTSPTNRSSPLAPLPPQRLEDLAWLGLPVATVAVLQPFVTVLPLRTPVNLNTAPAEVIYAAIDGLGMSDAQRLVSERDRAPFRTVGDARRALGNNESIPDNAPGLATATNYFEVRARLRLDQLIVEERSVMRRDGLDVKVIRRERGAVDPTALYQAAKR